MLNPLAFTPGNRIGGKYEIIDQIGLGGMGVVFRVREQVGGVSRIRALKTILPQYLQDKSVRDRFREEAEKMCLLEHENILPVLAYDEEGEMPYLVMPFVEGQSLKQYLTTHLETHGKPLPLEQVVEIGLQLVFGLAAAHGFVNPSTGKQQPIIHRDIKPQNIMIRIEQQAGERRLKVLIMDFGIAKLKAEDETGMTKTDVIGTVKYAAPEQVQRTKGVDPRADIYSLGMVLYEIYCGKHVFAGTSEHMVLMRLMQRQLEEIELTFPVGTPPALQALIRKCLWADRDKRYADVSEIHAPLRRILEEEAGRRLGELRIARNDAAKARADALQRRLDELAPKILADGDAMIDQADRAEATGDFTRALSLFGNAAVAFVEGAKRAEENAARERRQQHLAAIRTLRAAAIEAGAERLAAKEFTAAERALEAAQQALQTDPGNISADGSTVMILPFDAAASEQLLDRAEAAWIEARDAALERKKAASVDEKRRMLAAAIDAERSAFTRVTELGGPKKEPASLADASRALDESRSAEGEEALSKIADGERALEKAAASRQQALQKTADEAAKRVAAALEEIAAKSLSASLQSRLTAARRAHDENARRRSSDPEAAIRGFTGVAQELEDVDRAAAVEAAEAAEREARARAACEQVRERVAAARTEADGACTGPQARAAFERAEQQWSRAEAAAKPGSWVEAGRAYESVEAAYRAAIEAARNEADQPAATAARDRFRGIDARVRELGGPNREEATEHQRIFTAAASAEAAFSRGDFIASRPAFEQTAAEIEAFVRRLENRVENERREYRFRELLAEADTALQTVQGFASRASEPEIRRLGEAVRRANGEYRGGKSDQAIASLESTVGELRALVGELRARAERERLEASAVSTREQAKAASDRLQPFGSDASGQDDYVAATSAFQRGQQKFTAGDFVAAGQLFAEAAQTWTKLEIELVELARRQRLAELGRRRDQIAARAATLPSARAYKKTRKSAAKLLDEATSAIQNRDEAGASALLDQSTVLVEEALHRAALVKDAPAPAVSPKIIGGVVAAVVAVAIGIFAWLWREPTSTQPIVTPTAIPEARPTTAPTEGRPTPQPTRVPTTIPTAVPTTLPTALPTSIPTVAPTLPPKPTIKVSRVRPQAGSLSSAYGKPLTFEAIVSAGDPGLLEWRVDGDNVGSGAKLSLDSKITQAPGRHEIVLASRGGGELEKWRLEIVTPDLRFDLSPRQSTVEVEPGDDVRLAAVGSRETAGMVSYSWEVDDRRVGATGAEYTLSAREAKQYDVRVRAEVPWGKTFEHQWTVIAKAKPPAVLPTPVPAVDLSSEVRKWINNYCALLERKDVKQLRAIGQYKSDADAEAAGKALDNLKNLSVTCSPSKVAVEGDRAVVSFTRTDSFTDPTGRERSMTMTVSDMAIRRSGGKWTIENRGNVAAQ